MQYRHHLHLRKKNISLHSFFRRFITWGSMGQLFPLNAWIFFQGTSGHPKKKSTMEKNPRIFSTRGKWPPGITVFRKEGWGVRIVEVGEMLISRWFKPWPFLSPNVGGHRSNLWRGSRFHSPSQKGHNRRIARIQISPPGDSKWPFDPLVGGHLTLERVT